jgi:hypothetical protein
MAQFLKVRVQTDIQARRRVKERQYGHSQQDNSTAHTTKKSMSSLILMKLLHLWELEKKNVRVTTLQPPQ